VACVRGRTVVGRPERLGGEEPVRRAPKAGEPAREGDNGEFPDHQFGAVMAGPGLRPAESLLNNRSRRHVLRLMSLPQGDQANPLTGYDQPWRNG